jgi:hypothetical protein
MAVCLSVRPPHILRLTLPTQLPGSSVADLGTYSPPRWRPTHSNTPVTVFPFSHKQSSISSNAMDLGHNDVHKRLASTHHYYHASRTEMICVARH